MAFDQRALAQMDAGQVTSTDFPERVRASGGGLSTPADRPQFRGLQAQKRRFCAAPAIKLYEIVFDKCRIARRRAKQAAR
jgi:hypothetical protein